MRRGLVLALVALAALLTDASVARSQKRPPFTLAVVRQDGVIIPFVSLIDDEWKNVWPVPRPRPEIPISLADVPKTWWPDGRPQAEWTLWLRDGTSRPLKVAGPAWFRAQCLANVGLRTDFRSSRPLPSPEATPFPKEGLATSVAPGSEPSIEPITVLDDTSQDWRWLLGLLPGPFGDAEDFAFSNIGSRPRIADPQTRANTPIAIEALYRTTDAQPGGFVYYFEAVRRYPNRTPPKPGEPPCDWLTYASGWVRLFPGGKTATAIMATVTNCYRWNVRFVLPLGIMRGRDRSPIWVVQESTWQAEWYAVVELLPPAVPKGRWLTPGGDCF